MQRLVMNGIFLCQHTILTSLQHKILHVDLYLAQMTCQHNLHQARYAVNIVMYSASNSLSC